MSIPRDPEEAEAAGAPASGELPADTHMGPVELSVADLGRSTAFYESALGLRVRERDGGRAVIGTPSRPLLVLREVPGAAPARGHTGLYHFALLVPERTDLARWLVHVARERIPLVGLSDHYVSEAIYLSDPDEHGIEIYWDRPREGWEGEVARRMTTVPLDTGDLLGVLGEDPMAASFESLPDGTTMGHVHLRVADVASTIGFYRDVLGFGLMAALGSQAAFLSAGGYHHHIGANTWESAGAAPAPKGSARLERMTIAVPDTAAVDAVGARLEAADVIVERDGGTLLLRDPSGNPVALVPAGP